MKHLNKRFRLGAFCAFVLMSFIPQLWAANFANIEPAPSVPLKQWSLEPLELKDSKEFFEAYRPCSAYLFHVLGWSWPTQKISPEMNVDMVRYHVSQHQQKVSYTYVLKQGIKNSAQSPKTQSREIYGAVYINPVEKAERLHIPNFNADLFDAEVSFWFSKSLEEIESAETLFVELFQWLEQNWPFQNVLITVNKNYQFAHQQLQFAGLVPFTEDGDTGEQFYRLK